jgi:hypothetical protein
MLGAFVFRRLRSALLPDFQRLWRRDADSSLNEIRKTLSSIEAELTELRAFRRRVTLDEWVSSRREWLERVERVDLDAVRVHVDSAIARAALDTEPTPHMVVDDILPRDVYDLLVAAIPPADVFNDRDPVKRDLEMPALETAPELTRCVWRLFDEQIVGGIVGPGVFERFQPAVASHYAQTGGEEFGRRAAAVPHRTFAGRIQLRRPGYRLAPHLDPKRVVVTGLFYFPRPGDTESYGTQLFSLDRPFVASGMATCFPENHGLTCSLARTAPYRANSLLVFVNSGAAHGASLPRDATLSERYAYQFYVKPEDGKLKKLLRELPPEAQAAWAEIL